MNRMLIDNTEKFVKDKLEGAEAGHDWFHIERVWKLSQKILSTEKEADEEVVNLAALLHDIADPKFHNGDETLALQISRDFLMKEKVSEETIDKVLFIIKHLSFKNKENQPKELPIEFKIVQDADRLDAIGAIGVARAFNFGGYKNNPIYNPELLPEKNFDKEQYKKSEGTTINHFYEKLLLLKDLMQTTEGKKIAEKRHQFMLNFLETFYREWNLLE
ncbi:HD domain-containing protein [Riemerella anatipestifer]|uniref:HD domain-containing protein n=1 Tax=Riemerella anatipestifer TaxID=34085 RepID=UPI002A8E6389|nr:HD domain-containing protein [Riemerella anatipestifer]